MAYLFAEKSHQYQQHYQDHDTTIKSSSNLSLPPLSFHATKHEQDEEEIDPFFDQLLKTAKLPSEEGSFSLHVASNKFKK